ncbi:MAG: peptidoglycan DD-metalloendopeptidase family protein [Acidimicrobiales bacterium]|nr:peptidoglycan DD-metalloendopeptidase family protein [Acidimicrobiales bacterium]
MPFPRTHRIAPRLLLALAVAAALLAGPVAAQDDDSIGDIRQKREDARDAEAEALEALELLELEDERIAEVLAQIQAAVDNQTVQVAAARQQLEAAEAEVESRERAADAAAGAILRTEAEIQQRAVDAFVGTNREFEPWLTSEDLNQTAIRLSLLDFAAGSDRDLLDELRVVQVERDLHLLAGEEARAEADALQHQLADELAELEERRKTQARIQAELQDRIEEWEREADQRAREAQEFTDLIKEKQAEELGFAPGDPGAASVEGFILPTQGQVGSRFGPRIHPIFGSTRVHSGVDIGAPQGQAIWAAKEGRVIFAGWKGGYGNAVIIQHEGNVATLYAHMSEIRTSDGEWVDQAEVIGLIGSTGWSTGPHLHFETRVDGEPKDPELFLPG